jgi:hypothetical protein
MVIFLSVKNNPEKKIQRLLDLRKKEKLKN